MTRHWLNRLRQERYTYTCRQWSVKVAREKKSVTTRLIIYTCTFQNSFVFFKCKNHFFLRCRFQSFFHAAIKTCVTVLFFFISLAVSEKQNIFCEMSWCCWCSLFRSSSASITQTNRRPSLLGAVVSPQPAATRWYTQSAETRDENAIKVITSDSTFFFIATHTLTHSQSSPTNIQRDVWCTSIPLFIKQPAAAC